MRPIVRTAKQRKMNKMERTNHGRGSAIVMGLARMHCVREGMCVCSC